MFFPSLPSSFGQGQLSVVWQVFHGFVQRDSTWRGPPTGFRWIPPPHAKALPCLTNFVGTSAQAHLLVMSLNQG